MSKITKFLSALFIIVSTILYANSSSSMVTDEKPNQPEGGIHAMESQYVPGEVLVKFKDGVDPNSVLQGAGLEVRSVDRVHSIKPAVAKFKKDYKLEKDSEGWYSFFGKQYKDVNEISDEEMFNEAYKNMPETEKTLYRSYKITLPEGMDVREAMSRLQNNPDVEYVELNRIVKINTIPNDPYYLSTGTWGQPYDDLWGIKKIQCEQAWDLSQGEGIVVAVIDTGVDYNHPDLAANIWTNPNEIPGNGIDDDNNDYIDDVNGWDFANGDNDPMDGHGHGTHCSGTIAAVGNNSLGVIGVAPSAKIMPVKGLSDDGSGSISSLADCVRYAVDNGANVLSNSWGGSGTSQVLADAFHYAYSKGCVAVAAAGNENADASGSTPANIDTVMAVAAIDYQNKRAYFSNYGLKVDVSAPGVDILSTFRTSLQPVPSGAIVTVNSDSNKKLVANIFTYSANIPGDGLNKQILYAGLGYPEDFNGQDFTGKIALIGRGELYFSEKAQNAQNAGASGVIIYNNQSGNFLGTLERPFTIPVVSVSQEDGEYLKAQIATGITTVTLLPIELGFYKNWSGTSMACPHVAALAALLKAEYPSDPPDAIRARMMAGADNIGALNPGFESSLGEGRINAHRSLTAGPQPLFKLTGTIINNFRAGNDACLVIFLQNMWQDAFGLTATLSTDNPGAIIKNDTVLLGDIASGQTTSNSAEPFIISLNPGMVYGQTLELTLFLQCRGGYTKTVRVGKTLTGFSDTGAASNLPLRDMLPEQINMRDYDNDGYTDIFFTGWGGSDLYKNLKDGTFRKVTDEAKVGRKINSMGALFVDIDNDGDIDLFKEDVEESTLFLNNGDGTFKDITSSSGIGKINCMAAAALDYNDDGYLDIVWSSGVLSNNKNNTFTPLPLTAIGIPPSYGIDVGQIISFDYNNDGFPDLLFISYSNGVKLMHNNGDSAFADVTEAAGLTGLAPYMAGVAAGDYDNDGYFDIFLSGERGDALYKNNGNGTFTDITKEAINIETGVGGMWWGTAFFDYDNDGYLDLYLTTGGLGTNMLYRNNRDGTFTDVTDSMFPEGIAPNWAAAAIGDINNDGALDIYAPGSSFTGSTGGLLMNQVGLQNNWIKVKLEGVRCNKEAIGARVYVRTGGLTQIREVNTSPVETQPVHFGLGQASVIDEIEVIWPDGNVQKINDITPSQILTITEIVNKPPVFDPVRFKYGSTTIDEGTVVWFFITASDPDGDPLTYSASNLPDGAKFQPPWSPYWTIRTPNFYWCPLYDQAGVYPVVITASDGKTEVSEIVTITVNDVNTAPFLKVYAGKTITVKTGELLRLGLIAFDRQLDHLTFEAVPMPAGAAFTGPSYKETGFIRRRNFIWTPTADQAGVYPITFTVSDGRLSASQQVTVTVESPPVVSIEIESAGQWGLQNVKLGEKRNNIGTGGIPIQKIKNTGNVPVLVDIGYSAPSQGGVMPGTQQGTDTFIMMLDSAVIPPISKINFGKVIQPGVAEPLPLTYGAPTGLSGQINGMSLNLEIRAYAANQVNNPSPHSVE